MPAINLGTTFTADISQFQAAVTQLRAMVSAFTANLSGIKAGTTSLNQVAQAFQNLAKQTQAASGSVPALNKQIGDLSGTMNRLVGAAKVTASYGLVSSAIFGVVNAMKVGATAVVDYDQALANLAAISGATKGEMIGMADVMQQTARASIFSTKEVADGMTLLAQAGFSATETMQAIKGVTDLAVGTLSNMEMTTDLVSTTLRAFQLDAVETTRVVDVMANAINKSKLDVEKLRVAFNYIGAGAQQAGIQLEETAASMMVLADNGMRASTIGTALRQVISRMIAPSAKLREEFASMGIKIDSLNPKLVGYKAAMENITKVLWDSTTKTVDMAKAYQLFGLRGAQAAAILAQAFRTQGSRGFDAYLKAAYEVGSATEMAAIQMEGLGAKLKNLVARFELIAIAIGESGVTGAVKFFVDILRYAAAAVEQFFKSGVGKIALSMVGWTAAFTLAAKAVLGLGTALNWVAKIVGALNLAKFVMEFIAVSNVVRVTGETVGKTGAAMWAFRGLMAGALGPIMAVATALGLTVAAIRYYAGATDRMIKSTVEIQQSSQTAAQTLDNYASKIQKLQDQQAKGVDVGIEHEMLIKRLQTSYPELADSLNTATSSMAANYAIIGKASEEALKKSAMASAELSVLYAKQREEAKKWGGVWEVIKGVTGEMLKVAWEMVSFYGGKIVAIAEAIVNKIKSLGTTARIIASLVIPFYGLAEVVTLLGKAWDALAEKAKKFGENSIEAKEALKGENEQIIKAAQALDKLTKGKATLDQIVSGLEEMRGIKLNAEQIELVAGAIKKVDTALKDAKENWKAALEALPTTFQDMFKDLGPRAQVAFAAAMKQMDTAISAYDKKAAELGQNEEQRAQAKAAIQAESLTKFIANLNKENMSKEESLKYQYDILVKYEEMSYKTRQRFLEKMAENFDAAMLVAKTEAEREAVRVQYREQFATAETAFSDRLAGIHEARNQVILNLENEHAKKVKAVQEKLINDLVTKLEEKYKKNQELIKNSATAVKAIEKTFVDQAKKIREKEDPNATKKKIDEVWAYQKKVSEIENTLSKARIETDQKEKQDLYLQALKSTDELVGEVKNQHNKIHMSFEETQYAAKMMAERIKNEAIVAQQDIAATAKKENETMRASIEELMVQLENVKNAKDAITSTPLTLQTEEAIKRIEETHGVTSKFKDLWDKIKSKSITLTVKYNYPPKGSEGGFGGGGGDSGGGDSGGGDSGVPSPEDAQAEYGGDSRTPDEEHRFGGIIGFKKGGVVARFVNRLKEAGEVVRAQTGKWIGRRHGRLPGYGGGDRVRVLAEPGEYFVRKESVQKYGEPFFNRLNAMKFPSRGVDSSAVAKSVGGIIGGMREELRMAKGGSVPRIRRSSFKTGFGDPSDDRVVPLKIVIKPTYMTGDKATARRMAQDIMNAVYDLNKGRGYSNV